MTTTIKIHEKTKRQLDCFREHMRESYDEVIAKLVRIAELARKEPELSQETIKEIEEAREQYRRGEYYTMEEIAARLGICLESNSPKTQKNKSKNFPVRRKKESLKNSVKHRKILSDSSKS